MRIHYAYFNALKLVLILAAVNSALWHFALAFLPSAANEILFNVIRAILVFLAGWVVVKKNVSKLWGAAFAGALVYFVDHPVVTGIVFITSNQFQAFVGVLLSFILFVWLPMILAALGGFAKIKWDQRNKHGE